MVATDVALVITGPCLLVGYLIFWTLLLYRKMARENEMDENSIINEIETAKRIGSMLSEDLKDGLKAEVAVGVQRMSDLAETASLISNKTGVSDALTVLEKTTGASKHWAKVRQMKAVALLDETIERTGRNLSPRSRKQKVEKSAARARRATFTRLQLEQEMAEQVESPPAGAGRRGQGSSFARPGSVGSSFARLASDHVPQSPQTAAAREQMPKLSKSMMSPHRSPDAVARFQKAQRAEARSPSSLTSSLSAAFEDAGSCGGGGGGGAASQKVTVAQDAPAANM